MMTESATPRLVSPLRALHILLVAVDPPLSLALASPLAEAGVAVTVVRSESAALGKIADEIFDAAIVVDDDVHVRPEVLVAALQRARRPCLTVLVTPDDEPERTRELSGLGAFEVVAGVPGREAVHAAVERCVRATWSLRSTLSALARVHAPALPRTWHASPTPSPEPARRPPHEVRVRGVQSKAQANGVDIDSVVNTLADDGQLSPRERAVLRYIARGYRYREIGDALEISPRTVKMHAANVRRKCGVGTRWELLRRVYGS